MVMAMVDGLRIQALLDPHRATLPVLEKFTRLISTPEPAKHDERTPPAG
jgi:hypothetical protein